jgi:membrane-bound serine protease (ClpP class)
MQWELVIGLIIAGAILMGMEVYVYGFVLGSIGVVLQFIALTSCFKHLEWHGAFMMLTGSVVLDGLAVYVSLRYFTSTKIGKRMVLSHTQEGQRATSPDSLPAFIGKEGTAESMLRPSGMALVDGKRMDVVTEGEFLERGVKVKVVAVKEGRLVVKKIS